GTLVERVNADHWVRHVSYPVRFADGMLVLHHQGLRTFVECGPRPVLLTLGQATLPDAAPSDTALSDTALSWLPSLHPQKPTYQTLKESLAALYQQGHRILWTQVYAGKCGRRIPLPTYPFQRQRHWLDRPSRPERPSKTASSKPKGHPLLGQAISTPLASIIFQQQLSANCPSFLSGHQIQQQVILPGSGYLEMAVAAGAIASRDSASGKTLSLKDVAIVRPLLLNDQFRTVQTILRPESTGYRFEIYSQETAQTTDHTTASSPQAWTLHCEGTLTNQQPSATTNISILDIQTLQQSLTEQVTATTHYAFCQDSGLNYSGAFESVQTLWRREGEVLVKVQVPSGLLTDGEGYHLHPAILDACFQGILAALPTLIQQSVAYAPIGVDWVERYQSLPVVAGETVWSHIRLRPSASTQSSSTQEVVSADVSVFDAAGQAIAHLSGLSAKQIPPTGLQTPPHTRPQQTDEGLYVLNWQSLAAEIEAAEGADSTLSEIFLVGHKRAQLDAITAQLTTKGLACTSLLLANDQQINDLPNFSSHVVYIADDSAEVLDNSSHYGLLQLMQALVKREGTTQLWLVTSGTQRILDADMLAPASAMIWGMGKTLALEYPEIDCICLDLSPTDGLSQQSSNLIAEIKLRQDSHEQFETQVAYRQGVRYVPRLEPLVQERAVHRHSNTGQQLKITMPGVLSQLQWQPVSRTRPGTGEVELRVQATGLNFRDVLNALGLYPGEAGPLGLECVGEVVAVGPGVNHVQVGDIVMAIASAGFADYVTVSADLVAPKPAVLTAAEAATLPTTFLTAYYALVELGQLHEGDRILIHAAAGGVGQAAVQIAQHVGATVFATASSPKWPHLQAQGIQHIFNSRTLDFAEQILAATKGEGVTVVLNSLSGEAIERSLSTIAPEGRFLEIGKAGIWSAEQMAQQRPDVNYQVIDLVALTARQPKQIQAMLHHIESRVQQGHWHSLPVQTFPATQAIDAFRQMQQGKHIGKVVVSSPMAGASLLSATAPHFSAEVTYLITGGLGALGLQLAKWLVNNGAGHLILLGRRAPTEPAIQAIASMTEAGAQVQTLMADVANFQALSEALAPALNPTDTDSPPLKGVFHLAGQVDDALLPQQTKAHFDRVMAAKVKGAWHLHQLTQTMPLAHFVLFSSAASLLGSAGQINYAAANSFLDAIAHYRQQARLPALSINWGPWDGDGLAASPAVRQRLARAGTPLIDAEIGLAQLGRIMTTAPALQRSQVSVLPGAISTWVDVGSTRWQSPSVKNSLFAKLSAASSEPSAEKTTERSGNNSVLSQLDVAIAKGSQSTFISRHLREQIA
ncbi:MAG: SDR family NAD(P)-dependent oxidoreductase, partial [Cyanobacteria bacterium P01_D01_bin.36]